jgi:phosphomannomutase
MDERLSCFKAYDVRGVVPDELNPDLAYKIARAFADEIEPKTVCIGRDARLSGPAIAEALTKGLNDAGVDVIDLGLAGTEMVYFAVGNYGYDGGIMITASHNPPEYNGLKMVRSESRPISSDSGLFDIEERARKGIAEKTGSGTRTERDILEDFTQHLLQFADIDQIKPMRILADTGNGAAGPALARLAKELPVEIEIIREEPDGDFPTGVPNPILKEARTEIEAKMKQAVKVGAPYDFGVAWDGDYDRCFLFSHDGEFIEGYYIVGLLTKAFLSKNADQAIIYDPRLIWCTEEIIKNHGGRGVMSRSGHAFIKERMRKEDAVYGGEMSAHHYFKDNWYCDSGMIPLMLVLDLLSKEGTSLASQVEEMIQKWPCSGEVNSRVDDVQAAVGRCSEAHKNGKHSRIDGLSVEYEDWRFNLRASNTEPLLRLNVETRGDLGLMEQKKDELLDIIRRQS